MSAYLAPIPVYVIVAELRDAEGSRGCAACDARRGNAALIIHPLSDSQDVAAFSCMNRHWRRSFSGVCALNPYP